jgi:hypothetical protein
MPLDFCVRLLKCLRMKATPFLVLAISFGLAACGGKEPASSAKQTNQTATGNPLTAPVDYLGAVGNAKRVAEKTVDTASLNRAIQLFYAQEDRYPKDLNELVAHRYFPSLPTAPYGTKILYNAEKGEVRIVKQQ